MRYEHDPSFGLEQNETAEDQLTQKLESARRKFGARKTKALLAIAFVGLSFVPEIRNGAANVIRQVPGVESVAQGFYETFLESEQEKTTKIKKEFADRREREIQKEVAEWDTEEEKFTVEQLEAEFRGVIPKWAFAQMKEGHTPPEAEPSVKVSGFESLGVSNEDVSRLIKEALPIAVSQRINYVDENIKDEGGGGYGMELAGQKEDFETLAETNIRDKSTTYYKPSSKESVSSWIQTVSHEECHMGLDWVSNPKLTYKDRLFLLYKVKQSLTDWSHTHSDYVESINRNHQLSDELANWKRLKEYAAEVFGKAFQYSTGELRMAERQFVEVIARKSKPDFNFEKAKALREELKEKITKDKKIYESSHSSSK